MIEHYTYLHRRADTNEIFYVGKGKDRRAWTASKRNKYWKNIVARHGLKVEIVSFWRTAREALDHEVFLIACFKGMGINLCNMTRGGDGLCDPTEEVRQKISAALVGRPGRPMSEFAKSKLREARIGSANPMFGKTLSEETKAKMLKSRQESGYTPTQATGRKISQALINGYHPMRGRTGARHHNSKPVACIDTGMVFASVSDAVRFLQALGHQNARDWNICAACSGKRKSAYGARWMYHNDELSDLRAALNQVT